MYETLPLTCTIAPLIAKQVFFVFFLSEVERGEWNVMGSEG